MNERDWTEDFGHENGNYQCRCGSCGAIFSGHKRRVTCKVCAAVPASPEPASIAGADWETFIDTAYWDMWCVRPVGSTKFGDGFHCVDKAEAERLRAALSSAPSVSTDEHARVVADVLAERRRQVAAEGWTPEHDDEHDLGELAGAAAAYATYRSQVAPYALVVEDIIGTLWPWDSECWKPKDRRRDLVRAAALLVAEIERLDRAAPQSGGA